MPVSRLLPKHGFWEYLGFGMDVVGIVTVSMILARSMKKSVEGVKEKVREEDFRQEVKEFVDRVPFMDVDVTPEVADTSELSGLGRRYG